MEFLEFNVSYKEFISRKEISKTFIYVISQIFDVYGKIFIKRILPNFKIFLVSITYMYFKDKGISLNSLEIFELEENNINDNALFKMIRDVFIDLFNIKVTAENGPFSYFFERIFREENINETIAKGN